MFYDNLLAVCKEKGVYLTNVVEECGGRRGSISGWKRGAWPSSELVTKLSVRLNVSTDRLLLGKDQNDADEIRGISDAAVRMAAVWDSLDEAGKAITLGEIFKRAEAMSESCVKDSYQYQKAQ